LNKISISKCNKFNIIVPYGKIGIIQKIKKEKQWQQQQQDIY